MSIIHHQQKAVALLEVSQIRQIGIVPCRQRARGACQIHVDVRARFFVMPMCGAKHNGGRASLLRTTRRNTRQHILHSEDMLHDPRASAKV